MDLTKLDRFYIRDFYAFYKERGLLLSEWVKIVMKSFGTDLGSGFAAFLIKKKCGMIYECDFIDGFQMRTAFPAFVPFHAFAVFSVIPKPV